MTTTFKLGEIAALIFLVNLPFGYWRAGARKFSPAWFAAVHLPVLIAIALRVHEHITFRWTTLPLFVAVFFAGQWTGGKGRRIKAEE